VINTLLGKIANLFEKDFLFAAFLPTLIFFSAVAFTGAGVLGIGTLWYWVDSWTASQKTLGGVAASVALVVFAYVIHAARPGFINIWSGKHDFYVLWLFFAVSTWLQKRRFRRMEEKAGRVSPWKGEFESFRVDALAVWRGPASPAIPAADNQALLQAIGDLDRSTGVNAVHAALRTLIAGYFGVYSGSSVSPAYKEIKDKMLRWESSEDFGLQSATSDVDREYGVFETIRPTRLGNVIESYNFYSYKRYKIETEIFWPRLRSVIKSEYLAVVDGSRILLDFALAMATLSLLFAILVIFVGPWIWYVPWLWIALFLAGLAGCVAFYRLAVLLLNSLAIWCDRVSICFVLIFSARWD
jgi:hypothetical protein